MLNQKNIDKIINESTEEDNKRIDWTKAWSKKYSILSTYENEVNIGEYASEIREMLSKLHRDYGYNELDSMLVLKDILYQEWKNNK